jgi:hypothetical protein
MTEAPFQDESSARAVLGELSTEVPDRRKMWSKIAVILAFALYFLWDVFAAVSNFVGVLLFAANLGAQLNSFAWLVLVSGMVLPVIFFVVGVIVARKRTAGPTAIILFVALAAVSTLSLSLEALVRGTA